MFKKTLICLFLFFNFNCYSFDFLLLPKEIQRLVITFLINNNLHSSFKNILHFKQTCKQFNSGYFNPTEKLASYFSDELPKINSLDQTEIVNILLNGQVSIDGFKKKLADQGYFATLCEEIRTNLHESIPLLIACKKTGIDLNTITFNYDATIEEPLVVYASNNVNIDADFLDEILYLGLNPNTRVSDTETALGFSYHFGQYEKSKCLLEHGADPNLDKTIFHCALTTYTSDFKPERYKFISWCLDHGLDPNDLGDTSKYSPLTWVISYDSKIEEKPKLLALISLLLDHGADPFLEDKNTESPFELVKEKNYKKIEQLFLEHLNKTQ